MHHVHKVIVVLIVLAAAGCAVGPDFKQPATKTPAAWSGLDTYGTLQASTAVPGPAALAAWWSIFNDPALTGLVEKALAANLDLRSQRPVCARPAPPRGCLCRPVALAQQLGRLHALA